MTNTLFIGGYTTVRDLARYRTHGAVVEAADNLRGVTHYSLIFPILEIGGYPVLPCFPEMVALAKDAIQTYKPEILIGHCVGASVAVELMRMGWIAPKKAILLCPPVSFGAMPQMLNPRYRILGRSTGIPKAPFRSQEFKQAAASKARTITDAVRVFADLRPGDFGTLASTNLSFVSASNDVMCDPKATARLAGVLGAPHHELADKHSIRQPASVQTIRGLIENFMQPERAGFVRNAPVLPQAPVPAFTLGALQT